jgi:hypothetical protein
MWFTDFRKTVQAIAQIPQHPKIGLGNLRKITIPAQTPVTPQSTSSKK